MLDEEHQLLAIQPGDDNVYVPGRISQHNVVMVCLPGEYGTNNAAVVATNLKRTFPRIRATLMVGIGGGCPSQADLYLGDVVVGTRVMQYDIGKVIVGGCFQETAVPKTPAPLLNAAVSTLRSLHSQHNSSSRMASLLQSRLSDLQRPVQPDRLFQAFYEHSPRAPTCDGCDLENLQRRGLRLSDEPKIHYGVIASGNRVMKDGKTRDDIAKRLSALCFEMEAASMMDNLQCLPIRALPTLQPVIQGKAGAGKSTMMKFLFLETKKKDNTPTASFFFNARGDYLEKSITRMYRSLLWQLLKLFPDRQSVLNDTDIIPWSQQGCPNLNILKELLRGAVMTLGQRSFTCFINTLDECDEQEVRDIVQYFEDLTTNTTNNSIQFRVCFSSRPYPYIHIRQGALLTLKDQKGHTEDLTKYVKNRLNIRNPSLLAELQTKILDKAGGIFMWIVLVVEILNKETNCGALALRKKISEILSELSNLFRSILKRDKERQEWLLLCVLWVLCVKRPLGPEEFRHALWAGLLETDEVDRELPNDTDDNAVSLVTSSSKGLVEYASQQILHHANIATLAAPQDDFLSHFFASGRVGVINLFERRKTRAYSVNATPLHEAVAQLLIEKGAGINTTNKEGRTALMLASLNGHEAVARLLIEKGADINTQSNGGWTALMWASLKGHEAVAQLLIEKGAGINTTNKEGRTALMLTSQYRYEAVAQLLIEKGADINIQDTSGWTALIWASQKGHEAVAQLLIKKGADINIQNISGGTALIWASEKGHEAVAQLLIEKGADINIQDVSGWTALIWASQKGHEAVAQLLIEKGADINTQDNGERTALMWASGSGYEAVVRLLIEKGADINTIDKEGWTVLMLASLDGHEAVARLLIEKGADINA
ncbi:NACHT and ankyrin domain-containing protein [Colletotrichum kahawae]|uniref:NACHT and ankyrin domain-containing protein n=1 Tax=Colletotrichum kahawae TaxID=34407 RepID=A0AAD9YFG4_COLKA|nr:NACHT and ankyrin domain-containing protein [Colletotrichum kahawae]